MLFAKLSLTLLGSLISLGTSSLVTASSTPATPQAHREHSHDVAAPSAVGSSDAIRHRVRIYFVRHGDTDWSQKQNIEGQSDLPLNRRGRRHAKLMGEMLKQIPFRIGYTSTLRRTWQTLDAISDANEGKIFYHIDCRIMGQDMGELTGKPYSTVDWTKSDWLESPDNDVEPRAEFVERLEQFVASAIAGEVYINRKHPEGREVNLLVVGPGTAFIPMLRRLRKMGGESDEQLDAELPTYYPHSIIPVVTIDEVDRIPVTPLHVVDWDAADQKHIPVSMSLMRVPAPSASAE